MKKLLGFPHASWFYSLTIVLVIFSLLFSPLAGLGSRALAEGNESAAVQIEPDLGNLTEITQIIPNVPPVISGVQVTNITTTWATIVWTTDKPADTVVNYGNSPRLGPSISDAGLTTDHSILLSGLEPGVTYYYEVQSTDYSLNTVTDNNGGVYYSFTTPSSDSTQLDSQFLEQQPSEPQKIESPKTNALVSPDKDTELKSPSEKITLDIPAGAASENLRVDFTELTPWGSTGMKIINQFELNAYAVDRADAVVSKFDKELQITIKHSPEDLGGLDTDSLRLFYLDEKAQQWILVESSKYDKETMILTATVDHFTEFGEQANPAISGPGRITDAQVSLSSGTATFSYPIEVPSGPGGFQPKIELTYNSGVADEMKNKRSVGSWVGIGWTLDLGGISYDEEWDEYYLNVNGVSSKLVKDKDGVYHTVRESFYKITRGGQTWHVYDQDGTYYRFGNTTNSQRYFNGGQEYYRWDLDYVRDTHGNSFSVIYYQTMSGTTVRSSYPNVIRYNNNSFEIYFSIGVGYDPTYGNLRLDNPRGTANFPAPPVVENCWLNSIEARIDGSPVRKYVFTYNTTPCYLSNDYYWLGGIYYSGNHTLTSITQVGADGSSTLPATTFTYTGCQTHLHATTQPDYNGNPGNPATFNWPHLTTINNGYGATVTFSYTEKPSSTADNIWTREVVTTKTINPGIGPTQTYQYTYTGNPQYIVLSPWVTSDVWHSEYRGFYQVRETDAAGNYVQHYYYTTGTMLNEYLTGKESTTEWYNASNFMLKRVEYDWQYRYTAQAYGRTGLRQIGQKDDVAVASNGDVYTVDSANNRIVKYDSFYFYLTQWGSQGSGNGQFNNPSGVAVDSNGNVWVADYGNNRVQEFDSWGTFIKKWNTMYSPLDIAVDNNGFVYIVDWAYNISLSAVNKYDGLGNYISKIVGPSSGPPGFGGPLGIAVDNNGYLYLLDCAGGNPSYPSVMKYTTSGTWPSNYIGQHGSYGCGDGGFYYPQDITVDSNGNHWVVDQCIRSQKFAGNGTFLLSFPMGTYYSPSGIAVAPSGEVYTSGNYEPRMYASPYFVYLSEVRERTYTNPSGSTKVSKTRYLYDSYGNVVTEYHDGDTSTTDDDATVQRVFYPNTSAWILDRPARERVYATITGDVGGANQKSETRYYYDGANSDAQWVTPPTKGDLTRLQQYKDASSWVNSYYTYDNGGNRLTVKDPNNNTTTYVYDAGYHILPTSKQYPTVNGLVMYEYYTWDYGSGKIVTDTDVNNQTTTYEYDTFKRLIKVYKPGDSIYNPSSPTIQYEYNNWGTINQQHLKTLTKIAEGSYIWQKDYFDGVGRVVQTQAQGETEGSTTYTIISATTTYNNRGLVDRQYVSQKLLASSVNGYYTPAGDWKYTSYAYDALGRVTTQYNVDGITTIGHGFSTPWKELVTNERGYKKAYYSDAFGRLVKVEEYNASQALYSTTTYTYDVLNNLKQVTLPNGCSIITMNYDWLSRKTSMSDPDMGGWGYLYDNNGNLQTQTDAKNQTITFTYDALNRLTGKSGTGLSVSYTYDSTTGGNNGEGKRTGMTDASGSTTWKYDSRGRLIEEKRTITGTGAGDYTTQYTYNPADWLLTVIYPTGETVTQGYNGRGLPNTLSGSVPGNGNIVTSTLYNKLGQYTEINLGNGIKTTFGYYGVGGSYDTTGGYYGRLWEIKSAVGANVRQDTKYTWDATGNVASRQDVKFGGTESFTNDFLDRVTAVSGAYTQSFSYNNMGNILTMNGSSYTYGTCNNRPHAVTQVGSTTYSYDNNGNMITKGSTTTFGWNVENRLGNVTVSGSTSTFVYDGDGNRIKKIEGGQTTIYVNKYYEKNTSTGVITTYYYLGDKLVALRNGTNLRYIHQDSLGSTSVVTDSAGAQYGYTRYYPYGSTRDSGGSLDTDKKFTGQRLDTTGLYYYGARYYDPVIGRFISADLLTPDASDPQSLNRYSYVVNNPLKFADPSGLDYVVVGGSGSTSDWGEAYEAYLRANLPIPEDEAIIFLEDIDPENLLKGDLWNVGPRLEQLLGRLGQGDLTDIKLIGFSEGAATVGTFLARLAENPNIVSSSVRSELRSAILMDCPTGTGQSLAMWNYDSAALNKLPQHLADARIDISLADVWNRASMVHGGQLPGWKGVSFSYDSRPWYEQAFTRAAGPVGAIYRGARTMSYHNDVPRSGYALKVMYNTIYGH